MDMPSIPRRIVCLTEESVETLFYLEKEKLIVGVSSYAKRPKEVAKIPKVSLFTSSNYKKIAALSPDLIIGYSDIQKDIAKDLIERGFDVFIANHRSINGILNYIYRLGLLVDAKVKSLELVARIQKKLSLAKDFAESLKIRPKIYFEEWDDPRITAIGYVSELIELCGGVNIYKGKSSGLLAKDRFCKDLTTKELNPDIIIGCWCGKKVNTQKIKERELFRSMSAVKNNWVLEVAPEIFLQPGPALLLDGIDLMIEVIKKWSLKHA